MSAIPAKIHYCMECDEELEKHPKAGYVCPTCDADLLRDIERDEDERQRFQERSY